MNLEQLDQTLAATRQRLAEWQRTNGAWEGCLASSALATATACTALALHQRQTPSPQHAQLIRAGIAWLAGHQLPDGGWGDTDKSRSNLSTTALVWAAFAATQTEDAYPGACRRAEQWLSHAAGGLTPETLAAALRARYGKDQTFSVPILTMCALAGRLGPDGWRLIPSLPFELAALPQSLFRFLHLPVVSYALPALIAMGQVRHTHRPTGNPVTRLIRNGTRQRTLAVLERIQPSSGGFLEATPLTSFVLMSLIGAGQPHHPVVQRGASFLAQSARPDGSWPIDTHLATWVTTLAINAGALEQESAAPLRPWLLNQQYRVRHPYTGAAPGGWAWTPLSGGVPDADDTAGALLALRTLGSPDETTAAAATAAMRWLIDLQNADGGLPTFCRGWGHLPFDRSGPDLTAHALRAGLAWIDLMPPPAYRRFARFAAGCLAYLARQQRGDGAWLPLWFGNQHVMEEQNPLYGTTRVLRALEACIHRMSRDAGINRMYRRGIHWVLEAQGESGGWGGDKGVSPSIEETALAVDALASGALHHTAVTGPAVECAVARGVAWLIQHTRGGTVFPASPIGFYFAKLWYDEALYPIIWTFSALRRVVQMERRD